jgi:hypothetical protein
LPGYSHTFARIRYSALTLVAVQFSSHNG